MFFFRVGNAVCCMWFRDVVGVPGHTSSVFVVGWLRLYCVVYCGSRRQEDRVTTLSLSLLWWLLQSPFQHNVCVCFLFFYFGDKEKRKGRDCLW